MHKYLLISFCLFSFYVKADWEEESFNIDAHLGSQYDSSSLLTSDIHKLGLSLSTTQLFEGWGLKASHLSELSRSNTETSENQYSNSWSFVSRAFISDSANLELAGAIHDSIKTDGLFKTRNSNSLASHYIEVGKNYSGKIDLARDKQFWNMHVGIDYSDSKSSFVNGVSFLEAEKLSVNSQLEWQISEDSFLTSRIDRSESTQLLVDSDVLSAYLGFKTKYLGSSELQVFIGDSSSSNRSNIFSWRLTHVTVINEYSNVEVSSIRVLQETDDSRFDVAEKTEHTLLAQFRINDYLSLQTSINNSSQDLSNEVTAKRLIANNRIQFSLSDQWRLGFAYSYDDYSDDRLKFSQNTLQFQIYRELV